MALFGQLEQTIPESSEYVLNVHCRHDVEFAVEIEPGGHDWHVSDAIFEE